MRDPTDQDLIGSSKVIQELRAQIELFAPYEDTVLLLGETGSGKELVARAIHYKSSCGNKPFITVNCAAIPETLIESELFGHKKGAFTGAISHRSGLFKAAHGGTLFLDEIGDMPMALQAKLLRALQGKLIKIVGSDLEDKVNVRIIAATNRELASEVKKGTFREDLYYRLCIFPVRIPPLRERKEDIPELIDYFLRKHSHRMSKANLSLDHDVLPILLGYPFPGNIRELESVLIRAIGLCQEGTIRKGHIQFWGIAKDEGIGVRPEFSEFSLPQFPLGKKQFFKIKEEAEGIVYDSVLVPLLKKALDESGNCVKNAASLLGIERTTLHEYLERFGLRNRRVSRQ